MAGRGGSKRSRSDDDGFEKRFEDEHTLRGLLEIAGSSLEPVEVEQRFREAQARGESAPQVFPTLFEEEPRFPDPSYARRLYANLFGLWGLLEQGRSMPRAKPEGWVRPKKEKPEPPPPLFDSEPDEAWVAQGVDYLTRVDGKERTRLEHAFENREDALLTVLDEEGFSDETYLHLRKLLWELFSLVELARPLGAGTASPPLLHSSVEALPAPAALRGHLEASLGQGMSETGVSPTAAEAERARGLVERALGAFWRGRTSR